MKMRLLIRRTGLLMTSFLFFITCQGCGVGTEKGEKTGAEQSSFFDILEDGPAVPVLDIIYSETEPYPELALFLTEYYEIPEEYQAETRYYYNYTDLNGDGTEEIVAAVIGEYTKEDGGDSVLLLERNEHGFTVAGSFTGVRTPVIICDTGTNGWQDIIFPVCSSVLETGYITCRYHTEADLCGYREEKELFSDELSDSLVGTQILSNNLIDDMDKGTYLTLAE